MEQQDGSSTPMGAILAVAGGVLLAIGSVLTWAKASIDLDAFAQALGVDPAQLQGAVGAETSKVVSGTSTSDGKLALVCGLVAVILGVVAYSKRERWKVLGVVTMVAGVVGGGIAVYDITKKDDVIAEAKAAVGPTLASIGLDASVLDNIFKVTLGIGIWVCVIGGIVALVGGLMMMMNASSAGAPAMAGMPSGAMAPASDSGFGTSSVAGSMAPPTPASEAPAPAPAPAAPAPALAAPAPAPAAPAPAPAMPSGATDAPTGSGDAGGQDAPSP